jgi:bloom syndrome protein
MQVQTSPSSLARTKQKKPTKYPTSTMLTSPMSPAVHRKKPAQRFDTEPPDEEYGYDKDLDDFIVSDNDEDQDFEEHTTNAFERLQQARPKPKPKPRQLETREDEFGPPIIVDERMGGLPPIHTSVVYDFVDEAKSLEEKLRNRTSARKPFFTEANLRDMAIRWTLNIVDMKKIPGISVDRVQEYGKQFIDLVEKFHGIYNREMNKEAERDTDPNHRNVIEVSDDSQDDDFGGVDDGEDEEATSRFFPSEPQQAPPTRNLPWAPDHQPSQSLAGAKKTYPGNKSSFTKAKGRGNFRKGSSRKSYGSSSGVSSMGISKRKSSSSAKRSRAGSSKAGSGGTSKPSYARNHGNSGGGSSGGGIGMMPT